ncbi:MAG: amidohydrolase family protein [Flavobacteriaceae bacterium]|nr:amidohydrolase family protein [Flavobacteriaceae bacterium]
MKIDSHHHFWKYNPIEYNWIDESMKSIKKDFLPKDLKPILDSNSINGSIAVQAHQSEEETLFLLKLAEKFNFIKGVIGWLDIKANDFEERLIFFKKNRHFKGLRHIVQDEKNDFLLNPEFQNGISKLSKFDLTYDLLIYPKQLYPAIELVKKFPNQTFILDHIAKPNISKKINQKWIDNIKSLSNYQNVYCKISGMVTETEDYKWKIDNFNPFLDIIVNSFGVDRLLFGSDWPVCLLAGKYKDILNIVTNYFKKYSERDQKKILGENAIKVYNIN